MRLRFAFMVLAMATTFQWSPAAAESTAESTADPTSDFDFWQGEWDVTVQAALPDGSWRTAEGKCDARKVAGGNAHMETLDTGEYLSQGVRAFDVATGLWNYTMFDNLQLKGLKVWTGTFTEGVGTFEAKLPLPTGALANTRIVIDDIERDSFKWRLELSLDGESWRTAMKMDFRRQR
jgi:hypothetical protein